MSQSLPPIPLWLLHLPTVGGLVVPWITPYVDGRYLLGAIDQTRARDALHGRRCGVCGAPLEDRLVLLLRLSDLPRRCTPEPALHPQCAAYTVRACPMIAGRVDHYHTSPLNLGSAAVSADDTDARRGARAELWFSVWLRSYDVITYHGHLAASFRRIQPRRVRPIGFLSGLG